MNAAMFELSLARWPVVLLALLPALLNLGILFYVLTRVRRNELTYTFAAFVGALATWQFSEALIRMSRTAEAAAFWADALAIGALLIAPTGLHFALLFTEHRRLARSPLVLSLLYGPALVIEVLSRAGVGATRQVYTEPWGWTTALPAPWLGEATGWWVAGMAFVIFALLGSYAWGLPRTDSRRPQALLVAIGFAIPTIQGTVTQVVLPTVFEIPGPPIASTVMTAFSLATIVALRKYRFLVSETLEEKLVAAEAQLRAQERLLAESQRMTHIGSWEWQLSTNRVTWSDEMYRMHGHRPGAFQVTFEKAMEAIHPADAARIAHDLPQELEAAAKAFEGGAIAEFDLKGAEYRIRRPDGEERIFRGTGRALAGPDGKPSRVIGTVQDVTDETRLARLRHEAEERLHEIERLRQMDEFKSRFINTAAHELNTPLTPVKLQIHLLKNRAHARGDPADVGGIEILERNVERLVGLVSDLLESARLQSGRMTIRREHVAVDRVVHEAVESFEPAARERGVQLRAVSGPPVLADADRNRITQVLYNLLSNALKFTPNGGRIEVEALQRGGDVIVRVRDDGLGLTPEQIRLLFQPFSQVHPATTRARAGTGLGLYISKGIMELHGGRIWCESPGAGLGSTFAFAWPIRATGLANGVGTVGRRPIVASPYGQQGL